MLISYQKKAPLCQEEVFIADGAKVIGDVKIEKGGNIWYNAVLRGDENYIVIGENSNVQDNCTVHVTKEFPAIIGKNVTIGHNAVVHGCTIGDNCLIGMNATILEGAVIGEGSIIGANALVTGKSIVPPNSLMLGAPAKFVKEINVAKDNVEHASHYVNLSNISKQK